MDFTNRARFLRTPGSARFYDELDKQRELQKMGLSRTDYWTQKVNNEEDVLKFYQLYHPEYPDVLQKALAKKLTDIIKEMDQDEDKAKMYEEIVQKHKAERQDPGDDLINAFTKTL